MDITTFAKADRSRCTAVATILREIATPQPKEDVPTLPFTPAEEANFWFFLVAICHQTSPIDGKAVSGHVDGSHRRGWDFLVHAFLNHAIADPELLTVLRWKRFNTEDIISLFGSDLSDPETRASLIRDLAKVLAELNLKSVINLRIAPGTDRVLGITELLRKLASFEAYCDPVQKKSVFFLALMSNASLWVFEDEYELPAPVDYHEIRGHLRIGTVKIQADVYQRILNGGELSSEEDVLLRQAVREAISLIARDLGRTPNALHYFFWNLFRTFCVRDVPKCDGANAAQLPTVYADAIKGESGHACPFQDVCNSVGSTNAINEPRVQTIYY